MTAAARASYVDYRNVRTFGSLDGLRCLSIVAVVFHHSRDQAATSGIAGFGFLGVDLFFVISGFLIVTLLLRERDRNGAISLRRFVARRALRIMPLYYGVLLACVVLFGAVRRGGGQSTAFFAELPYLLTYTTNWVPATTMLAITWSLSAEEQFYLVWPAIQKYARRTVPVVFALLALSQAIQLGWLDGVLARAFGLGPDEPVMLRQTTFTPILLGVLLAHALHHEATFDRVARVLAWRSAPLVILGLLGVVVAHLPSDIRGMPRLIVHLGMTALVASVVVREDHGLRRWLALAPVKRIGTLSYGLYLLHMFALDGVTRAIRHHLIPAALSFPSTLAFALVLAELSYRFYESRFLAAKVRFAT